MDRTAYEAWKAETARSEQAWIIDQIPLQNRGEYLFYHGGQDGQYVWIDANGYAEVGRYEGAIPHIGEAIYTPLGGAKVGATAEEALRYMVTKFRMGRLTGLVDTMTPLLPG